jgi:hypothetical protein
MSGGLLSSNIIKSAELLIGGEVVCIRSREPTDSWDAEDGGCTGALRDDSSEIAKLEPAEGGKWWCSEGGRRSGSSLAC